MFSEKSETRNLWRLPYSCAMWGLLIPRRRMIRRRIQHESDPEEKDWTQYVDDVAVAKEMDKDSTLDHYDHAFREDLSRT
ncbi:MAG: hypothetical protein SOX70_02835 [Peptoniphilaceae bacterium]|nr:hypothetical protein [Peptoniphilaceae bacterium]